MEPQVNYTPAPSDSTEDQNDFVSAMADVEDFNERKSPVVKRIQSIDYENLTEDDERFLKDTIADYFVENFSQYEGVAENAERIKDSIKFLTHEEYQAVHNQKEHVTLGEITPVGHYDSEDHVIYFDKETTGDKGGDFVFSTLLHESFHFFGIENGAGFAPEASSFTVPEELVEDEEAMHFGQIGVLALCEGATQLFAVQAGHKMGFDAFNDSYTIETELVYGISEIIGKENFERGFFEMPLEEFRLHFEAAGMTDEELAMADDEIFTGAFAGFLVELGKCVEYCNGLLPEDGEEDEETFEKIGDAMREFCANLEDYLQSEEF